jgi:manganese/zinc/iron transport system permease protein
MTMLANSLSHTILIGIVIAFLWSGSSFSSDHPATSYEALHVDWLLIASLIMGLLTAFFTEFLTKSAKLQEDASTGLVFTSLFALGVILLTTLTKNAHIGTEAVMGNVDALQLGDLRLVYSVVLINLLSFCLFFKEFKITTFDPSLSRALGISPVFFNYLLMADVSATAIGAFRSVGVLMVLAFITGPALTARMMTHDLKKMVIAAVFLGVFSSVIGVALSRHLLTSFGISLSTAGIVVTVILFLYLFTAFWAYKIRDVYQRWNNGNLA